MAGDGLCIHMIDPRECERCQQMAPATRARRERIVARLANAREREAEQRGYERARAQAVALADAAAKRMGEARDALTPPGSAWKSDDPEVIHSTMLHGRATEAEFLADAIRSMKPESGE